MQILSGLTKAHTLGSAFFAQMSGFVCLQPHVWLFESRLCSGAWNAALLFTELAFDPSSNMPGRSQSRRKGYQSHTTVTRPS